MNREPRNGIPKVPQNGATAVAHSVLWLKAENHRCELGLRAIFRKKWWLLKTNRVDGISTSILKICPLEMAKRLINGY